MKKAVCIGKSEDFFEGKGKTIYIAGKEYAVFRHQGKLGCINNRCLHEGGPLGAGTIKDGKITCP